MRGTAITLFLLLAATAVDAQQHHPAPPPRTPPRPNPNVFTTPTPPPTVLPFQLPAPQPTGGFIPGSVFPPKLNPAYSPSRAGRNSGAGAYGAPYFYAPYPSDVATAPNASTVAASPGMLRVTGTPDSAQVFVDGFYVATIGDIEAQRVLTLASGPHRIELRAPGYTTTTFDVRIDPNETVTYRAALDRQRPQPPERTAAPGASKMYLIPNCYLGNVPPKPERLPPGCDIKRVHVIS